MTCSVSGEAAAAGLQAVVKSTSNVGRVHLARDDTVDLLRWRGFGSGGADRTALRTIRSSGEVGGRIVHEQSFAAGRAEIDTAPFVVHPMLGSRGLHVHQAHGIKALETIGLWDWECELRERVLLRLGNRLIAFVEVCLQ